MLLDNNVKIIMIEDDEGHARLIQKNLRRLGIVNDMVWLQNGREAMDYLFNEDQTKNDRDRSLVLLDLNLPEIDGFEVLERLKHEDATKKIPVIILTTTSNQNEIDRCYELGCNIYITKPVDYQEFCLALTKLGMMLAIVKMPTVDGE